MATNNAGNFMVNVDANKYMAFPNQCGFTVGNNAMVNTVTGDGTLYTPCQFNTEALDRGANFAGNTFIAPVSGIYLLSTIVLTNSISAAMTEGVLSIKTTGLTYSTYINPTNWRTGSNLLNFKCAVICSMTAAQTAIVELTISGGALAANFYGNAGAYATTNFTGILLS